MRYAFLITISVVLTEVLLHIAPSMVTTVPMTRETGSAMGVLAVFIALSAGFAIAARFNR